VIALLHGARAYGAVERYVETLARALGDDCVLVHPGIAQLERVGVPTIVLERPTVRRLAALLRERRPAVAHVTDVWPQAVVATRLARVPRVLVTHHTPALPRRDNIVGRTWQAVAWRLGPEVVYTSAADRDADGRRPSHVIPLGIDLERFARPRATRFGAPVIGNVGRLAAQKGQRYLLEAAPAVLAAHPDARFVIVGDGERRDELEELARGLPVTFTGQRDDVPDLLASFDVFACPSLFEGLCLAVVEAQAAGVPVVATPVGGIRDTVADGETGLSVPVADGDALARAIIRLLDEPELAARLADEARRRVRARFSEQRMVEETVRLYGAVAAPPAS
jgi:glycosyltransferase involved in cell wall biosynthesis